MLLSTINVTHKGRKQPPPQVYDTEAPTDEAEAVDEAADTTTPADVEADVEKASRRDPIGDAIRRHNAGAPTANRPGAHLIGGPTNPCTAPADTHAGNAAPGAPALAADRQASSHTPNSSSSPSLATRPGSDRALTPAPHAGVGESAAKALRDAATGQFTGPGSAPSGYSVLDLTRPGVDAARHFARGNRDALPGRAALSPDTKPANRSPERDGI